MLKNMLRLHRALKDAEAEEATRTQWEAARSQELKAQVKKIYDNNTKLFNLETKEKIC
jgi:hypothetical protein